ncbi:hypothetical protein N0V88_008209 [Collariella sp. IMI 366227]|nr:hypothetical protein N0V88_008209 [Collariella sp. IMI 366227]
MYDSYVGAGAAAPTPQVNPTVASSTSSLIDVDAPSVRTVPSDFASQEIQTDTQASRVEREEAEKEEAAARARRGRPRQEEEEQGHGQDAQGRGLAREALGDYFSKNKKKEQ